VATASFLLLFDELKYTNVIGGDLITWPATLLTGSAVYQLLTVQLYADFEQRARLANLQGSCSALP